MSLSYKLKSIYRGLIFSFSKHGGLLFRWYYTYLYFPKKGSLQEFIDNYSRNNKGLTVVQVGANDGISNDPIHKYIRRDLWKGVLLEPQKTVFHKYLAPLYANNPGIHTVNAAVSAEDGVKVLYKISFSEARWATGLASFEKKVLEDAITNGYVNKRAAKEGVDLPPKQEDYISTESIETICPQTLMKRYLLSSIDWLQIDTEGYDYEVIKLFDVAKLKPKMILFEHVHLGPNDLKEASLYLEKNGYHLKRYGMNTLARYFDSN